MKGLLFRAAVALLLVGAGASSVFSGEPSLPWPRALEEAATSHLGTLAAGQEAIRTSSLKTSFGTEETVQFDLVTHACHRGPGQAWREYGKPVLLSVVGVEARVRYPYRLFFRQALTLEEMFQKPWREGSDGEIEVVFQRAGDGWRPGAKKEILVRKEGDSGNRKNSEEGSSSKRGRKAQ